jgi:hypothetical protein
MALENLGMKSLVRILVLAILTGGMGGWAVRGADAAAGSTNAPSTNDSPSVLRKKLKTDAPYRPASEWRSLFDGKSLAGWRVNDFYKHGAVTVQDGELTLGTGTSLTGVSYTNDLPKIDYEVTLEAKKTAGSDFFCGLTVPVDKSHCSLIVGGWGGSLVGISCIDYMNASENETTTTRTFEMNRWYRIRFRVTTQRLEAWIDEDKVVNVPLAGKKISMRPGEIESAVPFGIASYDTTAVIRNFQIRTLVPE